jgi:ribonuclease HIII
MTEEKTGTSKKSDSPHIFVAKIDQNDIPKLKKDLEDQGFEFSQPPYTQFSAKKKGVSCTVYQSLKLTVQGKEMRDFIEFYLEPEVLKNVSFTYANEGHNLNLEPRIGVDEAGKGDFFGPLCIAAVFAEGAKVQELAKIGVKDSKSLTDAQIKKLAKTIRENFYHAIIPLFPAKYNELYAKFHNLNSMLAWAHSQAIENVHKLTGCKHVIIDQFAHESLVQNAVKRKKLDVILTQRHRGEEDIVVAAASILARSAFVEGIDRLSQEVNMELPKGASKKTITTGKALVKKWGQDVLKHVSKEHFRTTEQVISNQLFDE